MKEHSGQASYPDNSPSGVFLREGTWSDASERIVASAARLFRHEGYHGAGMDEIGLAAGVTGPGVYRYFESKEVLLAAVVAHGVERVDRAYDEAALTFSPTARLEAVVHAGVIATIDHLDEIIVYLRERRHLPAELGEPIREIAQSSLDTYIEAIHVARPALAIRQIRFMLQSMSGLHLCLAHFRPKISRLRLAKILTTMGTAALMGAPELSFDADSRRRRSSGASPDGLRQRASRREILLSAAIHLFRQHGFNGVGMDEIGAVAGIVGPGVYRHFASKEELLAAAMSRATEQLAASVTKALTVASPQESLERLVASYVDIAIDSEDLIALYLHEGRALSDAPRRAFRRGQREYIAEWVLLLGRLGGDRPVEEVQVAVHAAIGLVNGYAEGRARPPLGVVRPLLTAMTTSALSAFTGTTT